MLRPINALFALLVGAAPALCQVGQPGWISLDGSPAGTPPTVEVVQGQSDHLRTTVRLTIHGFWMTPVQTPFGTMQQIGMPGCGMVRQEGRPMVPQYRFAVGVSSTADTMRVAAVNVLQSQVLEGIPVMPSQPEAWEYPEGEFVTDPTFRHDAQAYANDAPFPVQRARGDDRIEDWRGVPVAHGVIHPIRARPASNRLVVDNRLEITFEHPGAQKPPVIVSRRFSSVLRGLIINADLLDTWLRLNDVDFAGNYLFLVRTDYYDTALDLAWHKMMQGYDVTIRTTAAIGGGDCETLRDAVQDWHATLAPYADNYVLLVGESGDLEMCYTGFTAVSDAGVVTEHYSDYRIGVLEDDMEVLYQDVGVGRLSVDDAADLQNQIDKIIAYETAPTRMAGFYDEVVLAAHPEEGRGYIESCRDVADWPYYLYPLDFTERYGDSPDGTVANVVGDINDGKVVVAYRGHGSSGSWAGWDYTGDYFQSSDVATLTNGSQTPVVFAIACANNSIDTADDSIGETWMEQGGFGAVFHYGSTRGSSTSHNNELIGWIFKLNYGDSNPGLWESTISAQFCARDLATCGEEASEKTLKQYHILGTPDLRLYQEAPYDVLISGLAPGALPLGAQRLLLDLADTAGNAVPHARVTAFKDGRILASRYADTAGRVTLDVALDTPGTVILTVNDEDGAAPVTSLSVPVSGHASPVPAPALLAADCAPNPFNPRTQVRFELAQAGQVRVRVLDARGRLVRTLLEGDQPAGPVAARWDGTDTRGGDVASGLYFYEVTAAGQRVVGKMMLAR